MHDKRESTLQFFEQTVDANKYIFIQDLKLLRDGDGLMYSVLELQRKGE